MTILVAYASKRGGTREMAEWIGSTLEEQGFAVDVAPAHVIYDLHGYDAVVLGGALYVFRWHPEARQFVHRHHRVLGGMPFWMFSSGPLDESAGTGELQPVRFVRHWMARLGAEGHKTFGGRLGPGYSGPLPKGDWRERSDVEAWARSIAAHMRSQNQVAGSVAAR